MATEAGARAVLAITSVAGEAEALVLSRTLVEEGLAACVSRGGVRSVYRWQGRTCEEEEVLLLLKTSSEMVEALRARLLALHPYECPEFLVFEASSADPRWLEWLLGGLRPA